MHWLIEAATKAGIKGAAGFTLRPNAAASETWEALARVAGMTEDELAARVAPGMRMRVADFERVDRRATRLVPERVARRFNVVPITEDDRSIFVATADPMNLEGEQQLEFAAGRRVTYELAAPAAITRAINAAYSANTVVDAVLAAVGRDADEAVRLIEEESAPAPVDGFDAGPIVRLTSVILRDAIVSGASDIHIEPGAAGGAVRFRIDGLMRVHLQLPVPVIAKVVSRIKVMSRLNIADHLRPQDGRARIQVDGRAYDLRISTVPTRDAEKAVVRILRPMAETTLESTRIPTADISRIRALLRHRDGIVAITGPTGSGKTTTIYGAIREIAARDVNVVTVEDPIEYEVSGITQIQVDVKRGVTFASALRSILRQDPDVIFVGEIRDLETARIAVQAAMTGHLVIATVHANDAMGAVARLRDLGVDQATLAVTMRGAVAQRLVRRLCPECAAPVGAELTPEETDLAARFGVRPVRRAVGCPACANTGYRGRMPVVEVATVTPAVSELVAAGAGQHALVEAAVHAGMRQLQDAGVALVTAGETTLQELDRVVGPPEADAHAHDTERADDVEHVHDAEAVHASEGAHENGREEGRRAAAPVAASAAQVLLVEDDVVQRAVARLFLEGGGFNVVEAVNGRDALSILARRRDIALVVTDLQMEEMGGAELLRTIRTDVDPALPVIVLTGSNSEASETALLDAGADDYLRKPIDANRLVARVKASLRRSGLDGPELTARSAAAH